MKAKVTLRVEGSDTFTIEVEPGSEPRVVCDYEQPVGGETVRLCVYFRHELEDLCQRWTHLLQQAHKLDRSENN